MGLLLKSFFDYGRAWAVRIPMGFERRNFPESARRSFLILKPGASFYQFILFANIRPDFIQMPKRREKR